MVAHIFLLFPDEDNTIDTGNPIEENVRRILNELRIIKNNLRDNDINFSFCYSSENLKLYLDSVNLLDDANKAASEVNQIKKLLSKNSIDIVYNDKSHHDSIYALWNILAEEKISYDVSITFKNLCHYEKTSLYSFCPNETDNTEIDIIEDAIHKSALPTLVKVPIFICADECLDWIKSLDSKRFSLSGNPRFSLTHLRWEKQSIFRENETGKYWYYDYFHDRNGRPHYERFNNNGTHDGEFDLDGNPIPNSLDNSKSISHVIHGK